MAHVGSVLPWLLIAFAAGAWFVAAFRIMHRLGAAEAAVAAGLLVALAVATMLWRWSEHDRTRRSLAAGRCPRCSAVLVAEHEPSRARLTGGVQLWECRECGYATARR